jgi:hypothetical protein
VLDRVYLNCDGAAIFHEAAAPSTDELEAVLLKIITRTRHRRVSAGDHCDSGNRLDADLLDWNG